jgi:WD40 repeat protein
VDGTVTLFDTRTRERIGAYSTDASGDPADWSHWVTWLGFHPRDGSLAIVGGLQKANYLHVIDAATQRPRRTFSLPGHPTERKPYYPIATYAADERSVVVAYMSLFAPETPVPLFLRRVDIRTGSPIGPAVRAGPRAFGATLRSTPDGRLLFTTPGHPPPWAARATGDETLAIDADTLRVVRRYPVGASTTAISPDGATLALGGEDGRVRLLDRASGRVRTLSGSHRAPVESAALSPDGRRLATGDESGNVVVWDLSEGRAIETLKGHNEGVGGQAFSPDGRTLYTVSHDRIARIWDLAGYRRLARPFRTNTRNDARDLHVLEQRGKLRGEPSPPAFALSPDGSTLAAARFDGRVDLIDAETLRRTGGFEAFAGRPALAIEYSPDGRLLAVAGAGGGVGLWDAGSGKRVGTRLSAPRGPRRDNPNSVEALAFGRGGLLAAAGAGGSEKGGGVVRIWDLDARELINPPLNLPPLVRSLAFSPDGSRLAIAFGARGVQADRRGDPDGVEVRDVRSDETLATLPADELGSVAFSPDGSLLAGGQLDGNVLLWATDGWARVGAPLASPGGTVPSVAFSPDGRTLATSHNDGAVVLWDVESQEAIGSELPGLPDARTTARFAPDGARLFAVSDTGRAIRWEVDPEVWLQRACALGGGGLTPEQWAELVPEQDYVSACPSG